VRALLFRLARLPNGPHGRVAFAAIAGIGLLLMPWTGGRSIGVAFALTGVVALLHGCAIATDWGGIWSEYAQLSAAAPRAGAPCR
jgi:hypothetical protein